MGAWDGAVPQKYLGFYCVLLTAELEQREEKNRRSSKLFPALGVMLGVSAAIMMI